MNTTKQRILHIITLIIAVTGGIMAYSDKLGLLSAISPKIAQYWPMVLVAATCIDRVVKIIGDAVDDWKLNGSFRSLIIAGAMFIALPLAGCAWTKAHKEQIGATGSVIASRVGTIALKVVVNAAVSAQDREHKVEFVQGISTGMRAAEGELVNSNDIKELVSIWTPKASHWENLGNELAALYEANHPKDIKEATLLLEQFAAGLDSVK